MEPVTENELAAKATAPRVTPANIEANIMSEHYFTAAQGTVGALMDGAVDRFMACPVPASACPDGVAGAPGRTGTNLLSASEAQEMFDRVFAPPPSAGNLGLLTFCVLVLRNGFTVVGQSACASPENFDADIGRRIAREDAVRQCWPLMGYELRSKLAARDRIAATYYVRHPDDSYSVADPQPLVL